MHETLPVGGLPQLKPQPNSPDVLSGSLNRFLLNGTDFGWRSTFSSDSTGCPTQALGPERCQGAVHPIGQCALAAFCD